MLPTLAAQNDLIAVQDAAETANLARPLAELVQDVLAAAARSPHTQRAYQTAIGLFLQFIEGQNSDRLPADWLPVASPQEEELTDRRNRRYTKIVWEYRAPAALLRIVTAATLDGFRLWRERSGDTPNTASQRVAAARVFLAVAYRDGILTHNQATALALKPYHQRQKRDNKPTGRRLSVQEVKALRAAVQLTAETEPAALRNLAVIDLMLFAGLRREEVTTLRAADIVQDNGRYWLVLSGKGDKTRRVKITNTLYQSLVKWLNLAKPRQDDLILSGVNKGGNITGAPLQPSTVARITAAAAAAAGIAPPTGANALSPHDLRRTCARNAYDNGAPLLLVQQMLGHTDPKTTARYIGALENDGETATDFVRY